MENNSKNLVNRGDWFSSPSISFSQLRLQELTDKFNVEDTAIPELKELRSNYFEPIYAGKETKASTTKVITLENLDEKDELLEKWTQNKNKSTKSFWRNDYDFTQYFKFKFYKYSKTSILTKGFIKIFVSSLACFVLCLSSKTGTWLGPYRSIMPLMILIYHPAHSFGTQLEMSILSELGTLSGNAFAILAIFLGNLNNNTKAHYGGIFALFIFTIIFLLQMIRLKFIRSYYFCLSMGIVLIYSLVSYPGTAEFERIGYLRFWKNFLIPNSIVTCLSLTINLLIFPVFDHKRLVLSVFKLLNEIKLRIINTIENTEDDDDKIDWNLVLVSESYREFANEIIKLSLFNYEDLLEIRNCINFIIGPLKSIPLMVRILPSDQDFRKNLVNRMIDKFEYINDESSPIINNNSSVNLSEIATPKPSTNKPLIPHSFNNTSDFYSSVLDKYFQKDILELLYSMIECLEVCQIFLIKSSNIKLDCDDLIDNYKFDKHLSKNYYSGDKDFNLVKISEEILDDLKSNLSKLDKSYKSFTKTDWFCTDLLDNRKIIDYFLFLRYNRQISKLLIFLSSLLFKTTVKRKIEFFNYPIFKAIQRLPNQCMRDRGKLAIFNYFQVVEEVEISFEKIYNMNTSKRKNNKQDKNVIRAINHVDYTNQFFKNENLFKYYLWSFFKFITNGSNPKNSFKNSLLIIMLSLPSLLTNYQEKSQYHWYIKSYCYWSPIFSWLLFSSTGVFSFKKIFKRFGAALIGGIWGLCCGQVVLNHNNYLSIIFMIMILIPSIMKVYIFPTETKTGHITLNCFSITVLEIIIAKNSSLKSLEVWNVSWSITVSIIVAILACSLINILIWPFIVRNQVKKSFGKLLLNLSQSYQSVNDRYVYRDNDDEPTDLTLSLSTIREIRVLELSFAVKNLVEISLSEASIINISINLNQYLQKDSKIFFNTINNLLKSCFAILNKIIEARNNAIQFNSWIKDNNYEISEKLLSSRRNSVSCVIWNFYIIASCFESENMIPNYLPSMLSSRKQLYDEMSNLKKLNINIGTISSTNNHEEVNWTEIHAIGFSKSITDIIKELEKILEYSKILLGEEK